LEFFHPDNPENPDMRKTILGLLAATLFSTAAIAQEAPAEKPFFSATQAMQLTAEVTEVDRENFRVTLRGPEGNERTLELGPEARRLDEVEVGDMVDVEFVQHMDLEVAALGDVTPGAGTMSAMARAPDDQRPGMIATETLVLAATVHAIDLEAGTFQLQWSEGIKEYVARDPENLKRAEVGDTVIVTFTEAIAMQLQEVPAED
jgi:hypothetical protein